MRTNIIIQDELIQKVIKMGGFETKKAAVEAGLELLLKLYSQKEIKKYRGKLKWTGSLTKMRTEK